VDDDRRMREALIVQTAQAAAENFDRLRKEYPQRHEFSHFSAEVTGSSDTETTLKQARLLGFI